MIATVTLFELIYSTNTVTHKLSGKAYERAFRRHILVDAALNTLLVNKLFGSLTDTTLHGGGEPSTHAEDEETETHCCRDLPHVDIVNDEAVNKLTDTGDASVDLGDVQKLYNALTSGEISVESVASTDVLRAVELAMSKEKGSMKDLRTTQLWLQYMDMIDILRNFIRSERIEDWTLHFQTLRNMLPYHAAAGHNSYTKSIYVYLQRLAKLSVQQPEVRRHSMEGRHVVRRSDRYWA